ncbi:MAG: amino acid ABC transporter ATP-binding protein [Synergistaceae bacterium]|nr:amino acid ABC transporter ATP-binding protein [Synergistaceae bacterium]
MGNDEIANVPNYPHQLSGGQQQRVAIARALILKPDILCFDEPTSALDPELTGEVLKVIRQLSDKKNTMIIVTHEMEFARDVSSHVIFMDGGRICEQGKPHELFNNPKEERTKQFLTRFNN